MFPLQHWLDGRFRARGGAVGGDMQRANDIPEVTVSRTGAAIPVEILRAAGIQPGDRIAFVRTTRGYLVVVRASTSVDSPSFRSVAGICPRPAEVSPEADQKFLRDILYGDDEL